MMAEFDLVVGRSLAQVLEILKDHPGATIVAGATDFIPFVRSGRWLPDLAVDITRLDELRFIRAGSEGLEIGALTTHAQLIRSPLVRDAAPVLARAAGYVAGPQVRARATLGGNICTASPAADTVPALLVLDAQAVLIGQAGERRLPLSELAIGPGKTARRPDELLHRIVIPPLPEGVGTAFEKVGKRKSLVISVVNGAALVATRDGEIVDARLALGAVAPTVIRCTAAEALVKGRAPDGHTPDGRAPDGHTPDGDLFAGVPERVLEAIRPIDDVRASAAYRRTAAAAIARRMLAKAYGDSTR